MIWGRQPEDYVKAYRQLAAAVKAAGATDTKLMWAPNVVSGSGGVDGLGGYTQYYPGAGILPIPAIPKLTRLSR